MLIEPTVTHVEMGMYIIVLQNLFTTIKNKRILTLMQMGLLSPSSSPVRKEILN